MADDNKIEIQIVLDDGSIKKGFANIQKQAEQTGKELESSFSSSFSGIAAAAPPFAVAIAAILITVKALKAALDFSTEGEKINNLNDQFKLLADREGLASDTLISGLEKSAKGLIDTEDLLQTANGAIAILGNSAGKLPEILDLATKSAAVFGGTSKEAFDNLVYAIETGNQRALKNAGIVLDTEKVYRDFAKTIGLTSNELTLAQKQSALLNATLEKGGEVFKGVSNEISPVQNSFTRLKVAINEVGDSLAKSFNATFGETIANFNNGLTKIISNPLPTAGNQLEETESKIKSLTADLKKLQDIQNTKENGGFFEGLFAGGGMLANVKNNINEVTKALEIQKTRYQALRFEVQSNADLQEQTAAQSVQTGKKLTAEQIQEIKNRQTQVQQAILQNENSELQSREKLLQFQKDFGQRVIDEKQINDDKLTNINEDTQLKILEINKTYSDQLGFTAQNREDLITSIQEDADAKRDALRADVNENSIVQIQSLGQAFELAAAGAGDEILNLQVNAGKAFKQIGKDAVQGLGNAIGGGFAALGKALVTGGDALAAFTQAFLNAIGQQAIASGTRFILEGIAYLFVPGLEGTGSAMIAAGAALAAFGGAISALTSGGGGATASAGGGVGGGSLSGDGTGAALPAAQAEKPQTKIEVNIAGSIFDTVETGSRIVNLINDAFDQNGVQVTGGVRA